jgi:hypothetical protein
MKANGSQWKVAAGTAKGAGKVGQTINSEWQGRLVHLARIVAVLAVLAVGATRLRADGVPPSITQQPTNQTVVLGESSSFDVAAIGDSPLAYQWFHGRLPLSAGASSWMAK